MGNLVHSRLALRMRAVLHSRRGEAGFTLLEIIIAFTVLAFMAVAAIPMLAYGMRYASNSATTTAANQRIQQTIETARVVPVTCTTLQSMATTTQYDDGRGKKFNVTLTLPSGCPVSANPQGIPVKIEAKRVIDNKVITSLTTLIFVPGSAV